MAKPKLDISKLGGRRGTKVSPKLHTQAIQNCPGLFVGWRKGKRGSTWTIKLYDSGFKYRYIPISGVADDLLPADGKTVISFEQASELAKAAWLRKQAEDAGDVMPGSYTVARAMADYLKSRETVRRHPLPRTRYTIAATIDSAPIAHIELAKLTHKHVKAWWEGLACLKARPGEPDTPEAMRKRQSTANRILTVLRAGLNVAYKENRVDTRKAWEKIAPYRAVDAPTIRYLTLPECKRLIEACLPDFKLIVRAALYTGMRYGEITALKVDAYNADSQRIAIEQSKSGKKRYIPLIPEGAAFFAGVVSGRKPDETVFTHTSGRHKGEPWQHSQQRHWMLLACAKAKIKPAVGFHILRHSVASLLAMESTPMPVIANLLGHADTRMTEKHYGHLSDTYVSDTLRANLPSFE